MCENTALKDELLIAKARIAFLENRAGEDSDHMSEMERRMKRFEAEQRQQAGMGQEDEKRQQALQQDLAAKQDENDALKRQLENLKKQMADGGSATELLSEQMDQVQDDLYNAEKNVDASERRADDLWKELEKMKQQLREAQEAETAASALMAKMEDDVKKQKEAERELRAQLGEAQSQCGKLQRETDAQKVKLRNSAAKLEASLEAQANCSKCQELEVELSKLDKTCKRLVGEKNTMKKQMNENERVWGQVNADAAKKLRDGRTLNRVEDLVAFMGSKWVQNLRRLLAGSVGSAIRNWAEKMQDHKQACALRDEQFPRMKGGINMAKRIFSMWTNAVVWRSVQRWKSQLTEHQREMREQAERDRARQDSDSAEGAKCQAQGLMQDLDRAKQDLEAAQEEHKQEQQRLNDELERRRCQNEDLLAEIDEMEAYIESIREDAQRELAHAERDALRELAFLKQSEEEARAALDRERETMNKELADSKAELERSKAAMDALEEDAAKAALKRTQVIGTGILHRQKDKAHSCIIVWGQHSARPHLPRGEDVDAMRDAIDEERTRFNREHSSLVRVASTEFTCAACGHSASEVAHPVLVLGDQDESPTAAATGAYEDVDIALALAHQKKLAEEAANIKNLSDLHRELHKRHIQDFDFMRDGDPDRGDRMCFTGFKTALITSGLSAQTANLESMFKVMARSLKSKINYQTLHAHLLAAARRSMSPNRSTTRRRPRSPPPCR